MTEAKPTGKSRELALGVVVYQAEASLMQRLQQVLDAGLSVYLFDNSPLDGAVRDFARGKVHCHYTTCGKNLGLGVGISAVCSQAYYDGLPALIFFDQDTVFDTSTLGFVEQFFTQHQDKSRAYSAVVFNAKDHASANSTSGNDWASTHDVTMAISSGTMFFLANLHKMNWHNATYFVDCVDYEFCLNSERHGFKIAEFSRTPGFDHLSEQPDRVYRFMGHDHAIRRYATARVRGTLWASTRLAMTALRTGRFRFFATMLRSIGIYTTFQIIARLIRRPTSAAPVSR